ncbi:MAG: MFS transporter [Anaerolineaceae bacterium]|nr:MFS transporter [Anaerolineaceae bacterium]
MSTSLFGDLALYAVLVTQIDQIGITLAQLGVLLSIHRFVRFAANPLAGYLNDRFGRRWMFLLGLFFAVLSTTGYAFLRGFWLWVLARVFWGMAWALINISGMNSILDLTTPSDRGHWMGVYNAWIYAGYGLGPLIGGLFLDWFDFRVSMLVCAALTLMGLAVAAIFFEESKPKTAAAGGIPISLCAIPSPKSIWNATRNPSIRLALALHTLFRFADDGIVLTLVTILLTRTFGNELSLGALVIGIPTLSGFLIGLRSLLSALVGPFAGRISDGNQGRLRVILIGLGISLVGFPLLVFTSSGLSVIAGVLITAIGAGILSPGVSAYLGDRAENEQQGLLVGVYATAGDVGSWIGPMFVLSLQALLGLPLIMGATSAVYLMAGGWTALRRRVEWRPRLILHSDENILS